MGAGAYDAGVRGWREVVGVAGAALALGCVAAPGMAVAEPPKPGALPGMPERLPERSGCVQGSKAVVPQTPWQQVVLAPQRAWSLTRGDVPVAVVDTGVDAGTPSLAGRVSGGGKDCVGHGTFVAGLIAARRESGGPFTGLAPDARIIDVPAAGALGESSPKKVATAVDTAVAGGARVVAVTLAAGRGAVLDRALRAAADADVLVVSAVTPADAERGPVSCAPKVPGALCVGALGPDGRVAEPAEARTDLLAPGISVVGIGPRGSGNFAGTGSAFSAAFVAGAAALLRAHEPKLTAVEAAARLRSTAYRNAAGGAGGLDLYAALTTVAGPSGQVVVAPPPATYVQDRVRDDGGAVRDALVVAAVFGGLVVAVGVAAVVVPRGNRRSWRPPA